MPCRQHTDLTPDPLVPSRRALLTSAGALFAWSQLPRLARAEGRDPRLLVIIMRGGLDGLGVVAPVGDPDWAELRGEAALSLAGKTPALALDSFFALNAAMPNLHRLYKAGQATFVHAVATPYRERSHFDGQDILESGLDHAGRADTGWLNRALLALESGGQVDPTGSRKVGRAFAVGPVTPLVIHGPAPVMSWAPQRLQPASDDLRARLLDLYQHTDAKLAVALEGRSRLVEVAKAGGIEAIQGLPNLAGIAATRAYYDLVASTVARFFARPDGPRVGALALNGWDTHLNEGIQMGLLANLLGALDSGIGAFETGMGAAWKETVVVLVTEFGRTARINGTNGTDHGTGTIALLVGGALNGGRVIADWPGLKAANLYENRDLNPTTDLRAVLKGLLRDHLRVEERNLANTIFPGSESVQPLKGLLA